MCEQSNIIKFTFGKYNGQPISKIFETDKGYVVWAAKQYIGLGKTGYHEKAIRECYHIAIRHRLIEPLKPVISDDCDNKIPVAVATHLKSINNQFGIRHKH